MNPLRIAFAVYISALLAFSLVGYNEASVVAFSISWGLFTLLVVQLVVWALDIWRNPPRFRW